MDKETLLIKLSELDFMAVDLGLYLNTHPNCEEAIEEYNKIIRAADTVRGKYEKVAGPMCSFRSINRCDTQWQWNDCPWPWSKNFNYGEEC